MPESRLAELEHASKLLKLLGLSDRQGFDVATILGVYCALKGYSSLEKLAADAGINHKTVWRLRSGKSKRVRSATLDALSAVLGENFRSAILTLSVQVDRPKKSA